jgi:dihydrodipicolinate synthase/N-acetylneuraminate lyase
MKKFVGLTVAMVTPFNEDGTVNYEEEKKLIKHFIDKGVHGILVSGGTGEFTMMNLEERKQVIATAVDAAKGSNVYIMAGITANSTRDTVELGKFSGECGADFVLIQPPHAVPVTREAMVEYFETVKANTSCGMILYHFPAETGVEFSPEEIIEMGRKGIFVGVKNTAGMEHTTELIFGNEHNPDLLISNGFDSLAMSALVCGADALINAGSNMVPAQYVRLYELIKENKIEEARELYATILPLLLFQEQNGNTEPSLCKYVLSLQGFSPGEARKPIPSVTEESKAKAKKLLALAESIVH